MTTGNFPSLEIKEIIPFFGGRGGGPRGFGGMCGILGIAGNIAAGEGEVGGEFVGGVGDDCLIGLL